MRSLKWRSPTASRATPLPAWPARFLARHALWREFNEALAGRGVMCAAVSLTLPPELRPVGRLLRCSANAAGAAPPPPAPSVADQLTFAKPADPQHNRGLVRSSTPLSIPFSRHFPLMAAVQVPQRRHAGGAARRWQERRLYQVCLMFAVADAFALLNAAAWPGT